MAFGGLNRSKFLITLACVVISPEHFNTALPAFTDEGTLASSTITTHSLTFLLTCCQSARILHEVYGHLTAYQYPLYDIVIAASDKLDLIVRRLPPEVQQGADSSQSSTGPVYMWRFLLMMMAYRSYIIHRSFFVKSLSDPRYEASRSACVRAAETIISLANKGLPAVFYRLWNTTLWLVAAGLVMGVDLVHAASEKKIYPDVAARRRRLAALVDLLGDQADRSGIGERGATLIRHICAMEHNVLAGSPGRLQLTRDDIFNILRHPNTGDNATQSATMAPETTSTGWDAPLPRRMGPGQKPQDVDDTGSAGFSTSSAAPDEMADIDFYFADSTFFMPQWGDGVADPGAMGGSGAQQNHLDALFADILPNPPT